MSTVFINGFGQAGPAAVVDIGAERNERGELTVRVTGLGRPRAHEGLPTVIAFPRGITERTALALQLGELILAALAGEAKQDDLPRQLDLTPLSVTLG